MNIKCEILTLIAMLFLHIVDDYYMQGVLANLKQRTWWYENHYRDEMYGNDYIIALIEHGFSWSCMIHVPLLIYLSYFGKTIGSALLFSFIVNICIHSVVDNLKANYRCLNLLQDQLIHVLQILITCLAFF